MVSVYQHSRALSKPNTPSFLVPYGLCRFGHSAFVAYIIKKNLGRKSRDRESLFFNLHIYGRALSNLSRSLTEDVFYQVDAFSVFYQVFPNIKVIVGQDWVELAQGFLSI